MITRRSDRGPTPNTKVPEFGECLPGQFYQPRPGAYAIVTDQQGRVAIVHTSTGYALPGGGMEPGETPEAALEREVQEECGTGIHNLQKLCEAVQYVEAKHEGHFAKYSTFFCGSFTGPPRDTTVDDHAVLWASAAEAVRLLKHKSQRWAVRSVDGMAGKT